jgi:hypothetical protein
LDSIVFIGLFKFVSLGLFELEEGLLSLLHLVLKSNFLQEERANLKLKKLAPSVLSPVLSDSEQTLNMAFTKFNARHKRALVTAAAEGPVVFVVELDK